MLDRGLLPGLERDLIMAAYAAAPGKEADSGKFVSPESSAALVANAFGFFLNRPADFPLSAVLGMDASVRSVAIERCLRFPWRGGLHPWLDAVIETDGALIAIESKRYEPFRPKRTGTFSQAYSRPVWGADMARYEALRDTLIHDAADFKLLDAAQLVKHAFGAVTQARLSAKKPHLVYLYASPDRWPGGRPIPESLHALHRQEVARFADLVRDDEVEFRSLSWHDLLHALRNSPLLEIQRHASAVAAAFAPL